MLGMIRWRGAEQFASTRSATALSPRSGRTGFLLSCFPAFLIKLGAALARTPCSGGEMADTYV